MIVGVCGNGFTGSGAVLDLLSQYDAVQVHDSIQLSLIYKPDGINSLKQALVYHPERHFSSDSAIRRFIRYMKHSRKEMDSVTSNSFSRALEQYLKQIIKVEWVGSTAVHFYQAEGFFSFFLKQRLSRRLRDYYEQKFTPIRHSLWPQMTMYYSFMDEDSFNQATKHFLKTIVSSMSNRDSDKQIAVFDQLFSATNPESGFQYFQHPKAIIVNRDPRDIYILAKEAFGLSGRFIPVDKVGHFIKYYRGIMESSKQCIGNDVLYIQFQDLIYSYDSTVKRIETFLEISETNKMRYTKFCPNVSINNTQLYLKHPQYNEDIRIIETELHEYLFDFSISTTKPLFDTDNF